MSREHVETIRAVAEALQNRETLALLASGAWSHTQYEVQDVQESGDEVVVLVRNSRFWGRHSGILTELPRFGMVFTFRDGKVVRFRNFPDHESALKAVGLDG
jgi:ketosteroid isomerase-like protein